MSKAKPAEAAKGKGKVEKSAAEKARGNRETVESIIIAVILAFLFRAFEAEAFVIPTGSMAPTLQGRHFDVTCEKCKQRYRTGLSDDDKVLYGATCPVCRYTMPLDSPVFDVWPLAHDFAFYGGRPDECAMSGDRILVSKFAYELGEPERWDIIVFKYPGNAKVNYIKRLVGLPGERLRVQYGNVYVKKEGDRGYHIARKPPEKVLAMLQLVDDTDHIADDLIAAGWSSRWQAWSPDGKPPGDEWQAGEGNRSFSTSGDSPREMWLRYHHLIPSFDDWRAIERKQPPADLLERQGQLICDFYPYNCNNNKISYAQYQAAVSEDPESFKQELSGELNRPSLNELGEHWVGDLAMECNAHISSKSGELLLDLVEGGVHYQCRIDVATGVATLAIDGGFSAFQGEQEPATNHPTANTAVKGTGKHHLRLANVDDQLFLWVDGSPIKFDGPTTYGPATFTEPANVKPAWTPEDPGDMAPAGVGTKGAAVTVTGLRILRDVYYIANSAQTDGGNDYSPAADASEESLSAVLSDPTLWSRSTLFDRRRPVEFPDEANPRAHFGPDQFFPMGDNSPASKDGRLWSRREWADVDPPLPFVERKLLIGKALFIYWPHTWNRPIPFITPNFERMRLIR